MTVTFCALRISSDATRFSSERNSRCSLRTRSASSGSLKRKVTGIVPTYVSAKRALIIDPPSKVDVITCLYGCTLEKKGIRRCSPGSV